MRSKAIIVFAATVTGLVCFGSGVALGQSDHWEVTPPTGDLAALLTSSGTFNDPSTPFGGQLLATFEGISTRRNKSSVVHAKREQTSARTKLEAGRDDLRSLLTLPSAAVPNDITFRPRIFGGGGFPVDPPQGLIRLNLQGAPTVTHPHLYAGIGTVVGGFLNGYRAGYRLSEFRLGFNSWESEKIAAREQGADMVQHFILGYGLTRYFLDNGSGVWSAGLSAFTYEFIAGEIMECFPQAGGISVRDVAVNLVAVTVGMLDHQHESPVRFWAGSNLTVNPSAPNEFDPYHIGIGVVVGKVGGLDLLCSVENWKDRLPLHPDLTDRQARNPSYYIERL